MRDEHRQAGYALRLDWGAAGLAAVAAGADAVVVVDVLSFTTTVSVAVERGASVVLGSRLPRRDEPFSLSPASMRGVPAGARVELTSPNGGLLAAAAAAGGAAVFAGSLRCATAVARAVSAYRTVAVVAAGERWPDGTLRPALEDHLGAGAVLAALDLAAASPEARAAVALWRAVGGAAVGDVLRDSASGRELVARGYPDDVALAAEYDVSAVVPVLRDGAFTAG